MTEFVRAERQGRVGIGTIARPERRNALNLQVKQIAGKIASMPPLAVQAIREAVRLGADVPLETALALERRLFVAPVRHLGPEGRNAGLPRKARSCLPGSLRQRSTE